MHRLHLLLGHQLGREQLVEHVAAIEHVGEGGGEPVVAVVLEIVGDVLAVAGEGLGARLFSHVFPGGLQLRAAGVTD